MSTPASPASFQTIGHNTSLYTPPSSTTGSHGQPPPLILLFTWNAAALRHITKYTTHYIRLFPTSSILLIRCFTLDVFRSSPSTARLLHPALTVVHQHTQAGGSVLVQSFSNGGGTLLVEFAKAWAALYSSKMPMRTQIIDSAPGRGSWTRSHAAITAALPGRSYAVTRGLGPLVVHGLLACIFAYDAVLGKENNMVILCDAMNSRDLFDERVPRLYLYSRADEMVGWEEVERHADEAEALGWTSVVRVRFEASAHVGHIREDAGKYWAAVLEAWGQGGKRVEQ